MLELMRKLSSLLGNTPAATFYRKRRRDQLKQEDRDHGKCGEQQPLPRRRCPTPHRADRSGKDGGGGDRSDRAPASCESESMPEPSSRVSDAVAGHWVERVRYDEQARAGACRAGSIAEPQRVTEIRSARGHAGDELTR